jgi:hypothetical protein
MNLTSVLDELGIKYCTAGQHHHVREGWIGTSCCWCPPPINGKGLYRLGIQVATGRCNCWVCGHHSLESALVALAKTTYRNIRSLLKNISLQKFHLRDGKSSGTLVIPKHVELLGPAHRDYLAERGFNPDKIEKLWGVGGIGLSNRLAWRLFIPVNTNGETVSWTTRSIGRNNPRRYVNASPNEEKVPIKNTLYGIDLVRNNIVITEGPTDVWRIGPGAVATFGLIVSPMQIKQISQFPYRTICFDNEPAAQKRATWLCETLSTYPGKTHNAVLDSEDPGSASVREIRRLREAVLD